MSSPSSITSTRELGLDEQRKSECICDSRTIGLQETCLLPRPKMRGQASVCHRKPAFCGKRSPACVARQRLGVRQCSSAFDKSWLRAQEHWHLPKSTALFHLL